MITNNRRSFIRKTSASFLTLFFRGKFSTNFDPQNDPFVLSSSGCGRATAYVEANKIVSAAGKTYFSWLNSEGEDFAVYMCSLDHSSDQISDPVKIGNAQDNHGGPALTIDSQGYFHIVYYPHHQPLRYRRSLQPHDISAWTKEQQFGIDGTYPTLICGPDDTLYCTVRRSNAEHPWGVELFTKARNGVWQPSQYILVSRSQGYSHFQESLAWSRDDKILHLFCRFHEFSDKEVYGRKQTIAYMRSPDFGVSWNKVDGTPIELPAQADDLDVLERGGVDLGLILRAGGMAVDTTGAPHLVYSKQGDREGKTFLVKVMQNQIGEQILLNKFLPKQFENWMLTMPGSVTFDSDNNMYIVAQISKINDGENYWGHPSSEVVLFYSKDQGNSFSCRLVSTLDKKRAHWLPNIERNTGHHKINHHPYCMYTAGPPGTGNSDILANDVLGLKLKP